VAGDLNMLEPQVAQLLKAVAAQTGIRRVFGNCRRETEAAKRRHWVIASGPLEGPEVVVKASDGAHVAVVAAETEDDDEKDDDEKVDVAVAARPVDKKCNQIANEVLDELRQAPTSGWATQDHSQRMSELMAGAENTSLAPQGTPRITLQGHCTYNDGKLPGRQADNGSRAIGRGGRELGVVAGRLQCCTCHALPSRFRRARRPPSDTCAKWPCEPSAAAGRVQARLQR
jgi:hypothetical protein